MNNHNNFNITNEQIKSALTNEQYNRFLNLNDKNKLKVINLLFSNTQPNLETPSSNFNGRTKVKSRTGSTKSPEITEEKMFDNNAFIDILILSSITASFSLISLIIIILYALK